MAKPLVSVIIPTFNRAHLIAGALESVVAQGVPSEIIVVDDGSTDDTHAVVAGFSARHAVTFVPGDHGGANRARNRGLSRARAPLVAFLDSDDRFLPQKLIRQIALLDDPAVGAAYCGLLERNLETGEEWHERRAFPSGDLSLALLERDVTGPTSTMVVRRTIALSVGGFDEALPARQDWDFFIRVSAVCRIGVVPAPLVAFGHHGGPRTASDFSREVRAYTMIREKYAARLRAAPAKVRRRAKAAHLRRLARLYRGHAPLRALGLALRAAVTAPTFQTFVVCCGVFLPAAARRRARAFWNQRVSRLHIASH